MMNPYVVLAVVIIGVTIYGTGYYQGRESMLVKLDKQRLDNANNLIEVERRAQTKQNEIVAEYLKQIKDMESENEKIKASAIRDTVVVKRNCMSDSKASAGVSAATGVKSDLRCYTETELQSKIERSVAITRECDQLAVRYNALLKACKSW